MEFRPRHAKKLAPNQDDKIRIWQKNEPVYLGGEGAKPCVQGAQLALVRFVRTATPFAPEALEFALARFAVPATRVGALAMRKRQIFDGIKTVGGREFIGLHTASENVVVHQSRHDLRIAPEIVDFTWVVVRGAHGALVLLRDFVGNQRLTLLEQQTCFSDTGALICLRHTTGEQATLRGYEYLSRPFCLGKHTNVVVLSDRTGRCAFVSLRGAAGLLSAKLVKETNLYFAPMGMREGVGGSSEVYGYSWSVNHDGQLTCQWVAQRREYFERRMDEAEPLENWPQNNRVVPG